MPFNKPITGFDNEREFVYYLNKRRVKDLNPIFNDLFKKLYGNISSNELIIANIDFNRKKTDIIIAVCGVEKRISIKKGIKNSVHVEGISSFIHFLIENGISRDNIITYLKYHYADGTTNGSGRLRISAEEYKKNHQREIDDLNKELNNDTLVNKAINRFIVKGRNDYNEIDVLIYGVVDDFIWIVKDDIRKIIIKKINDYSTAIHFSSLTIQPQNRCLNFNSKYDKQRFCVQIKWYNISDDIIENMNDNA